MKTTTPLLAVAVVLAALFGAATSLAAVEPVTFENLVPPASNRADEPLAEKFSLNKALHFLDSASLDWQQSWGCFTCHTNVSYLISRPNVSADAPAHREVRKYAEELVSLRWEEVGSRFDAEIIAIAAAMALNDAATTKKLHPLTRVALDRMWTAQRPEGDWKWPTRCGWPPMESDEHYGVTLGRDRRRGRPRRLCPDARRSGGARQDPHVPREQPAGQFAPQGDGHVGFDVC